jgi:rRNA biogenesis protein RRP5
MRVSLRTHVSSFNPEQWAAIQVGQMVKGKVVERTAEVIWLSIVDSSIRAALPITHLSDHTTTTYLQRLLTTFNVDQVIDDLVVIAKQESRGHLLVSHKPLLITVAQVTTTPYTFDTIQEGDIIPGYISNIADHGVFVNLLGGHSARVSKSELSDQFVASIADHFAVQQSILGMVTRVDKELQRIDLSLKRSVIQPTLEQNSLFIASYFTALSSQVVDQGSISTIQPGQWIEGTIEQQQSFGWIIQLEHGLSGFITLDQCKEANHQVNDKIRARILDVDYDRKIVDLSLKSALVNVSTTDQPNKSKRKKGKSKSTASSSASSPSSNSIVMSEQIAIIELVKEDYLVVSLPQSQHCIAFAATKTYNQRDKPFMRYKVGQQLTVQPSKSSTPLDRTLVVITLSTALNENINTSNTVHLATIGGVDLGSRHIQAPLDESLKIMDDIQPGRQTKARILAVKDLQINVRLADNLKGRIHVAELFNRYEDISDPSQPLANFKISDLLEKLTVIGWHKISSHKKLAITHRDAIAGEAVDLSLRDSSLAGKTNIKHRQVGDKLIGFVRQVNADYLSVCIAPEPVKDICIEALSVSRQLAVVKDLRKHFKSNMALNLQVLAVHPAKKQLTLGVISGDYPPILSFDDVKLNDVIAGQVHTVNSEHGLVIHLGKSVFGRVGLCDLFDEYKEDPTALFEKAQYVACAVVAIDQEKKHITLSLRASDTVKSTEQDYTPIIAHPVRTSAKDVSPGDLVSGYVRRITEKGCFITLGRGQFDAMIKIKDMSDQYVEEWKTLVKVGQLVQGRIQK